MISWLYPVLGYSTFNATVLARPHTQPVSQVWNWVQLSICGVHGAGVLDLWNVRCVQMYL